MVYTYPVSLGLTSFHQGPCCFHQISAVWDSVNSSFLQSHIQFNVSLYKTYYFDWKNYLVIRPNPHNMSDELWALTSFSNWTKSNQTNPPTVFSLCLRKNLPLSTENSKVVPKQWTCVGMYYSERSSWKSVLAFPLNNARISSECWVPGPNSSHLLQQQW